MSDVAGAEPSPEGHEVRARFERRVLADLLGPVDGTDETLHQDPRYRYLVGMLAPAAERDDDEPLALAASAGDEPDREAPAKAEQLDFGAEGEFPADEDDGEDGKTRSSLFPSSMGLSFAVEGTVKELDVRVTWGRYVKAAGEPAASDEGQGDRVWERHHEDRSATVELVGGQLTPVAFATTRPAGASEAALGQVVLTGRARRHGDFWLVELFLSNRQEGLKQNKATAWLFQPEVVVRTGGEACFVGRGEALGASVIAGVDEAEQLALEVQYRNLVEFAVGHGVGTHAEVADDNPQRAVEVRTSFLPTYEVPNTVPASVEDTPELAGLQLDMAELGACDDTEQLRGWLSALSGGYGDWLDRQLDSTVGVLEGQQLDAAEFSIGEARRVAGKVADGIDLVCSDPDALAAFRFANQVMHQQRIRTEAIRAHRAKPDLDVDDLVDPAFADTVDIPKNRRWRPFQLAFVLLNLPELVDPSHADRAGPQALVDVLFFPTGGGKTEAYLGLTAFTFAIRRLHADRYAGYDGSDGVAVLMRYTLRLLTAQQFERAAAMVCAAEVIRREDLDTWGPVPFRLGMWVGSAVTPNDSEAAKDVIEEARHYGQSGVSGASPVQLTACPWCGHRFSIGGINGDYHVKHHGETPDRRTLVYCPNWACEFSEGQADGEGVPVVTVDEEVYRLLPTFLIGTIDKFAQIPWRGETRLLFGLGTTYCERHGWVTHDLRDRMRGIGTCDPDVTSHPKRNGAPGAQVVQRARLLPPSLTIQDEFHLITGPLGSMAGLYETVVDELSSWIHESGAVVRPKVVASTATIRRATQQTRGVFDRGVRMFPPQVVDVADTFFAHQVAPEEVPGRRYLGVCAPARRLKEIENRVFTTVMGAAQDLYHEDGEGLGHLADPYMTTVGYFSSIRELAGMRRLAGDELPVRLWRINPDRRPGLRQRPRPEVVELTSRVSSATIREKLDQLGEAHRPDRPKDAVRPVDLLLATNMISVGVDVPRWGNMIVVGQPKSTAEYVQATSRVGRDPDRPGLVVTIYNWSRPRDMSHYESFEHYHATFYRHVEALSVTPFADRAIDRGLSAILIGLVRALDDDANANPDAQRIRRDGETMKRVVDAIVSRAGSVTGEQATREQVRQELQERLDELARQQEKAKPYLAYEKLGEGAANRVPLLRKDSEAGDWNVWTLPNSLRNTEPGVNILIDDSEPPRAPAWQFASDDAEEVA